MNQFLLLTRYSRVIQNKTMRLTLIFFLSFFIGQVFGQVIYIPMDESQTNHLKAYGIAYYALDQEVEVWWLLNHQGGSFAFGYHDALEKECRARNIVFKVIPASAFEQILAEIAPEDVNEDAIKLEKAPKIAVYTPDFNARGEQIQPWDDAVTLVLTYAEIPYDKVYDIEVMDDKLAEYDWLHLHHEDFTGQYGKFYARYSRESWYQANQAKMESIASQLGFDKVSQLKLEVAKKIKEFVVGGGFLFAMCSATDTYDIALAAEGSDICGPMFDGDPADRDAQSSLDFSKTLAFQDFKIKMNPLEYEHSDIDNRGRRVKEEADYFQLFDFSAKWDPVPTMLTQNHTRTVKAFMGQCTSFANHTIKPQILILGDNKSQSEARYIHGLVGKGQFTFYGGHDPEDYSHYVSDPDTDLELHPNSPGYRLILNNILFPAAKKQKRKT